MITKLLVIHDEPDFFGRKHGFQSELTNPDAEDVKRAFDKFRRRRREDERNNDYRWDYVHVTFENGVNDCLHYESDGTLMLTRYWRPNSKDEYEIEFWRYRESIAKHDPENYLTEAR